MSAAAAGAASAAAAVRRPNTIQPHESYRETTTPAQRRKDALVTAAVMIPTIGVLGAAVGAAGVHVANESAEAAHARVHGAAFGGSASPSLEVARVHGSSPSGQFRPKAFGSARPTVAGALHASSVFGGA